jgi:uncharacterized protein (TIGR02996 family)
MDPEAALLASIAADPTNDAPRLVYADWLDDHHRCAQAVFIRTQIARAQAVGNENRNLRRRLRRQELLALEQYGQTWAGPLSAVPVEWHYERGQLVAFRHAGFFTAAHGNEEHPNAWTDLLKFNENGWVNDYSIYNETHRPIQELIAAIETYAHLRARGRYALEVEGATARMHFSVRFPRGLVEYHARLSAAGLVAQVHSHITGWRVEQTFQLVTAQ